MFKSIALGIALVITSLAHAEAQNCDSVLVESFDFSSSDSATTASALSFMDQAAWSKQQSSMSGGGSYMGIGAQASVSQANAQGNHEVHLFTTSTSDAERRSLISRHLNPAQIKAWTDCIYKSNGLHVVVVPNQGDDHAAVIEIHYTNPAVMAPISASVATFGGTLVDNQHKPILSVVLRASTTQRFFLVQETLAERATIIVSTQTEADSAGLLWGVPKIRPTILCHLYRLANEATKDFDVTLLGETACKSDAENEPGPNGENGFNWSYKLECVSPDGQRIWAGGQNSLSVDPACRAPL